MAPALSIRAGRPEDVPQLVDVYFDAFDSNPVQRRMFPTRSKASTEFWESTIADDFKDPYARFQVIEDPESGRIAAFAKWVAPRPPGSHAPPLPPLDAWPKDGDPAACVAFFSELTKQHDRLMADPKTGEPIPHWYLELICTHSDFQGRGAAGQLLRYAEKQADEAGLYCYLDATPAGHKAYASPGHGFKVIYTHNFTEFGDYNHVFMRRDPGAGKS